MARWNSCNILDALTGTHRLWHFDAKGAGFVLDREHPAKPGESLPLRLTAKSWSSLWRKKLNVAWFPPENVFLKLVEMPAGSFAETLSMVELQLEKLSPIPVTQIAWTLHILPRRSLTLADGTAEGLQTVVVVIVERSLVEEFLGQLESRGYLADRLEMPVLDQLEAADAKTDGVWVYPSVIAGQNAALVAWWIGGVLRDLSLVTLPPAGSAGESLKSQFARLAWAGELEGWLTTRPEWHLVADAVNAGLWEGALREQLGESVKVVAPLTSAELAARTAHRSARASDRGNLLPPEFSERYRVQFVDRLWVRGLMAAGFFYLLIVGIYLAVIYCPLFGLDAKTSATEQQVVSLGNSYTNALQLKARYDILEERQNLKYAALDCWQLVADKLPSEVAVQRLSFADGKKLTLGGTVPQGDINKVLDFEDGLRKATAKNGPMFDPTAGDPLSEHIMGGGAQVSWSFGLLLTHAEDTSK
jgi:hypothetical protein